MVSALKAIHEIHELHTNQKKVYGVAVGDAAGARVAVGDAAGARVAAGDGDVLGLGETVGDGEAAGGCLTGTLAPATNFHSPFRFANVSRKR